MEVKFSEYAQKDLHTIDDDRFNLFIMHIRKLLHLPPRRHLEHGLPYNVDELGQSRMIYHVKDQTLYVIRCFTTHKEYEKWYNSFR